MPWMSDKQRRWGHSPAGVKALGGASKVAEWDAASGGRKLSDMVRMPKRGTGASHPAANLGRFWHAPKGGR